MTPFLLLPQIISSIFTPTGHKHKDRDSDKSLVHGFKLLQIIHYLLSLSLFFLRLFLSLLPSLASPPHLDSTNNQQLVVKKENDIVIHEGDSGIARALSQILSIMNDIPVTSRKYETVRGLAENIIDENLEEGCEVLREVNRKVLSSAFAKTLSQLEAAVWEQKKVRVSEIGGTGPFDCKMGWVWNAVRVVRNGAMSRIGAAGGGLVEEVNYRPVGWSAEKFAAEVFWLAQKLVACGNSEEAVSTWGSASNLAALALSAEPRVQASLVKVSAFLFKQAKETGGIKDSDETKLEELHQRRKMMLMSWMPLLCCAGNGTDSPILSNMERKELEKVLEDIIGMLRHKDEQEKVLALWLHHFTSSPSTDWPNLQACYARWCTASRKLLVAH